MKPNIWAISQRILSNSNVELVLVVKGSKVRVSNDSIDSIGKIYLTSECREEFNYAIQLEKSNLIDVDIENPSLSKFIDYFLPRETYSFGRSSNKVATHFLYKGILENNNIKYKAYKTNELLLEIRQKGATTVLPGSVYIEDGIKDDIIYYNPISPAAIDENILIERIKNSILSYSISSNWPLENGIRNSLAMSWAGFLLKEQVNPVNTYSILSKAIEFSNDNEVENRLKAIENTIEKYEANELVKGATELKQLGYNDLVNYVRNIIHNLLHNEYYEVLDSILERYACVDEANAIVDLYDSNKSSVSEAYLKQRYKNVFISSIVKRKANTTYVFNAWESHKEKKVYTKIVYSPGDPPIIEVHNKQYNVKEKYVNLWNGWGIEPKPCIGETDPNIELPLKLIRYLFAGDEIFIKWFLCWLAYPLQNLKEKNMTAVMLYSKHQGVGKNRFAALMQKIYGNNSIEIGEDILESSFQDSMFAKQFVIANEVTGNDRFKGLEKLKMYITEKTVTINRKYEKAIQIDNFINILLLTNHMDAVWIQSNDRRFFLWEITNPPLDSDFYAKYSEWLEGDGPCYFFDYLLKYDLKQKIEKIGVFNPKERAPNSVLKAALAEVTRPRIEIILEEMLDSLPPLVISTDVHKIITYNLDNDGTKITRIGVTKALQNLCLYKRTVFIGYKQHVIYAIKKHPTHATDWDKKGPVEWRHEFMRCRKWLCKDYGHLFNDSVQKDVKMLSE